MGGLCMHGPIVLVRAFICLTVYVCSFSYTCVLCIIILAVLSIQFFHSRFTDPLFITALKISMSVLHKSQSLVSNLLLGESSFQLPSTKAKSVVTWPVEVRSQSIELKVRWVTTLLERITRVSEEILTTGQ